MANAINSLKFGDNTYTFALPYGVCGTAADAVAKEVTVDNFSLETGATVIVKFTNANSVASPTLNVNGTGAKPIYRYGTTATSTGTTTTGWVAGAVQMFTYDGTGWIRDYWNNTTYSNVSLGQGYATCSTAAATAAKTASLSSYSLTTGGIVAVKFTNAVPASATLNINSKGAKAMYHRGSAIKADVIKAGDTATFIYNGSQYHLLSVDRDDNTTYSAATASADGLMSAHDKAELDILTAKSFAGGTAVTLNGTSKAGDIASFYAPTAAGTNGYILSSTGSGAPIWANPDTQHIHQGTSLNPSAVEINPGSGATHGGYIDFHFGGDTGDYTTRIIESQSNQLKIEGTLQVTDTSNTASGARVRNIMVSTTDLTAGTSSLATGRIWLCYE